MSWWREKAPLSRSVMWMSRGMPDLMVHVHAGGAQQRIMEC
jgi:hypothetical protein